MGKQELWRKFQLLLAIACGTYPAMMLLLNSLAPELLGWGWLFSAGYVLLAFVGIQVKGKLRLTAGIALCAVFVAAAFLLVPGASRFGALAGAALCCGLLMWSLKMGAWSSKEEIPIAWVVVGILCQLAGQLILRADRVAGGDGVAKYNAVFLLALFGFCLMTMLSMNRKSLMAASGKRQSVPESMKRRNSLMTVLLFALAVLAALLPSAFAGLSDAVGRAISALVELIIRLIPDAPNESEFGLETPAEILPGQGQGQEGGMVLNPIVEKIATFVGALLSIAFVIFLLWRIFTILRDKLRSMVSSLGKFASSVSEDYVDEITDTREDGTAEKLQRRRRGPRLTAREERSLPPEERIRYRYRRILHRHPEWEAGATARETLPADMARVYEKARYSGESITEEEAAAFTNGTTV